MAKVTSKTIKLGIVGFLAVVILAGVLAIWVVPGKAHKSINTSMFGVAIKGYDTVAYFTEGRALKGKKEFEFKYEDARWRFSNAANRDLFAADPERYIPQYGGY